MGPNKNGWATLLRGAFQLITNRGTRGAPNESPTRPDAGLTLGLLGSLFRRKASAFGKGIGDTLWQGFRAATQAMGARGYVDGEPFLTKQSSWIESLTFRPFIYRNEQYGPDAPDELRGRGVPGFAVPDREYGSFRLKMNDVGDLTMTVRNPSHRNTSGQYVYPRVPRSMMDSWTRAPSAGQFYWKNSGQHGAGRMNANGIQSYSDRATILLGRMKKYGVGGMGITSPTQSRARGR